MERWKLFFKMILKTNVISNFAGNFITLVINFLLVKVYLKYLTIEEYGILAFFTTLTSLFVILDMGLGLAVNKEVATSLAKNDSRKDTGNIIRSFELLYWIISIIIFLFILLFSEFISKSWLNVEEINRETLTGIVSLMALCLLFRWPISFYNNSISGFQKMFQLNLVKIIISISHIFFVYILFEFFDFQIFGFFVFLSILYFMNIMMLVVVNWREDGLSFIKSRFKKEILIKSKNYIIGIGIFTVLGSIYAATDKLIVSKFFLASELGYYSLASVISLVLLQFVYPISGALFPNFVENFAKKRKDKYFSVFRKGYQIIMILVFSISLVLILNQDSIVFLWTGSQEITKNVLLYLNPLIIGSVFYCLHVLIFSIYTALEKTRLINFIYLILFTIFLFLVLYFSIKQNLVWVSYSWVFSNFLLFSISIYLAYRLLGYKFFKVFILNDFLKSFLLFVFFLLVILNVEIPKFNFLELVIFIALSTMFFLMIFSMFSNYVKLKFVQMKNKFLL